MCEIMKAHAKTWIHIHTVTWIFAQLLIHTPTHTHTREVGKLALSE